MAPAQPAASPRVGVVADDLIWASRLAAAVERAGGGAVTVSRQDGLAAAGVEAVLVDLGARRVDPLAILRAAADAGLPTLAVLQHDDAAGRRQARAAGATRVTSYNAFHQTGPRLVARLLAGPVANPRPAAKPRPASNPRRGANPGRGANLRRPKTGSGAPDPGSAPQPAGIPPARYGERLEAARTALHDRGAAALLLGPGAELRWLAGYRFSGDIWGYGEGECYLPGSPVLIVQSSFAESVILETLVLSILNHDSAVAAASSRMMNAALGRPCLEMGSRRTHERAGVAAARAAYIAGFAGTSNLEAGRRYGVPTIGTSAHAFTLLHDDEREAFSTQVDALGVGTTLLVDTYDVRAGVRTAVEVAGPGLGAVRLDSGDLLEQAHAVRAQLDQLGARQTRIVVTSDLDEYAIAALAAAPVDAYGVGTSLVTGSGAPTAAMVYKLVAREGSGGELIGVAKFSEGKPSMAGRKFALRRRGDDGVAVAEVIGVGHQPEENGNDRPLLRHLVAGGGVIGDEPLEDARSRHAASLAELPATARQLSRGEPGIPTWFEQSQTKAPEVQP